MPRGDVAVSPLDASLDRLAGALGPAAQRDRPLGALTTYRVGGPAALLVEATGIDDLRATLASGDLCLTLGAGDLTALPDELLATSPVGSGPPGPEPGDVTG